MERLAQSPCRVNFKYCITHFMGETMSNWDDLRLFAAVVRGKGLAAASKTTGKSAPTLSRRMLDLEKAMHCELFHRHARGYDLTEQGEALFAKVQDVEAEMHGIWSSSELGQRTLIKVSSGTWMTKVLSTNMDRILGGDDDVLIRLISAEATLDISRRQAMIGIRNRRPHQLGVAGRKVGRIRFAAYATSETVNSWVRFVGETPSAVWLKQNVAHQTAMEVTDPRSALDLALKGVARALLPTIIGDREPDLMRVSAPIKELDSDQWLVVHADDRSVPVIRRTVDRIHSVLTGLHRASD